MSKRIKKIKQLSSSKVVDLYTNETMDLQNWHAYEQAHFPCVITGELHSWPALAKWRPPWTRLVRKINPIEPLDIAVSQEEFSGAVKSQSYESLGFKEFLMLSELNAEEPINFYMAQCPIMSWDKSAEETALRPLLSDIRLPKVLKGKNLQVNMWMNVSPVKSAFHYDSYHNFLCCVHGKKLITLVPPNTLVKSNPLFSESYNHLESSLPKHANKLQVSLLPGQVLFIPEGWWHHVQSAPNTVAISFWWKGVDQDKLTDKARGLIDLYICKGTLRRLTLRYAHHLVSKEAKKLPGLEKVALKNLRDGDTEFILEIVKDTHSLLILHVKAK